MVIKNNFNKKLIFNRVLFFAGLALFLLMSFSLVKELVNRRNFDKQMADYKDRIGNLQIENSALSDKILDWDKSSELEGNARTKLGLEKTGEHTVVIVRKNAETKVAIKSNQEVIDLSVNADPGRYTANPQKWWQYFFGK